MNPEFQMTVEGLKVIKGWFDSILSTRNSHIQENRNQRRTALVSLMAAATATRQYLAAVRANQANHNEATENHLAQLWTTAGVDMTEVDADLAIRYLKKADYWSDPAGWTDRQKDDRLIELDDVLLRGQAALIPEADHRLLG
jgi:hypothetical protein